jgi:hypothetical protein
LPNTIVALDIKAYDHVSRLRKQVLQRAFLALGPVIAAFKHCRPVICVDGTFLTGKYKSTTLTVVAVDGNNQLLPLAIAFVTPDFPKKTKCISYMCQDQVYTHMVDVMSEISVNNNKNVQELNHYIISLLHLDVRLEGLYNDQTITMKTQLHLHLPQASDWGHASLKTPRSR